MSNLPPLIILLGPTASGKTEMSLQLAKKYNGYIISADSRTIYKGFNIGTAKPRFDEYKKLTVPSGKFKGTNVPVCILNGIYHFMIDITTPDHEYSLAQYQQEVFRILKNYHLDEICGKIPFLVGGTGLYITAIVDNLKIPRIEPSKKLRESIEKDIKDNGLNFVYQRLLRLDPDAEHKVDGNNPRRVVRALEFCLSTGKSFTKQQTKGHPLFNILELGIKIDKNKLYNNIETRINSMIEHGLENEVKNLTKKYDFHLPAFSAIGYRQIIASQIVDMPRDKALTLIKRDTKRYVRRQMTWWRRDPRIRWVQNISEAEKYINEWKFLIR